MKTPQRRRYWTIREETYLRQHYPKGGSAAIMAAFPDLTRKQINQKALKLGVRYQGPHLRPDFMPTNPDLVEHGKATRFPKGVMPANARPAGKRYVRNCKGTPYYFIRPKGERKTKPLHRHLWEQAHGQVLPGHVIRFRDGDTLNCTLDNLECITHAENARRNARTRSHATNRSIGHQAWAARQRSLRERLGLPVNTSTQ